MPRCRWTTGKLMSTRYQTKIKYQQPLHFWLLISDDGILYQPDIGLTLLCQRTGRRQLWLCTGIVCRYWPDVYLPANMQCSNMVPFSNIGPTCTGQLIFNTTSGSNMVLLSDIGPTCTCQLIFSTAIGSNMVLFFGMGPTCTCQLICSTTSGSNMVLFSDIGPTCTCQVMFSTTSDSNMALAFNVLPQLRIRWFRI